MERKEHKFFVARDKDNRIFLFGPGRDENDKFTMSPIVRRAGQWKYTEGDCMGRIIEIPEDMFPEVHWKDSEPALVDFISGNKSKKEIVLEALKLTEENSDLIKDKDIQDRLFELFEKTCDIRLGE